jgi:hypothetical protein
MNAGTLIFLLLLVGAPLAMFSMRRGGHAHGGTAGGGGGCCGGGGHSHGGGREEEQTPDTSGGQETKPLLGPPGTQSGTPVPAPAEGHKHRGC